MPRRPRLDRPGLLHHVMNRAMSRRTAFESRADIRRFLALVARAVRDGRIEVHAYAVLATHFHLLVRSLDGNLSETMRRIENGYVRWFNRKRRRDSSLFRGRFRSIPVESGRYLQTLVRYIDQNPVEARLVGDATAYPHGSASSQSGASRRRPWLDRTLIDHLLPSGVGDGPERLDAYRRTFAPRLTPALQRFVARRIAGIAREPDALDDLVGTASENVRAWMVRKAQLADGTHPGLPMVTPETVAAVVAARGQALPTARIRVGPRTDRSTWAVALVALLRDVAGESYASIARRTGSTSLDARRRYAEHRAALETDADYAATLTELAREALERDHADSRADLGLRRAIGAGAPAS